MKLIDRKKVGERIRQAVEESPKFHSKQALGLELRQYGLKGGDRSASSVSRWTMGDHITLENLNILSAVLGKPALWFLEGTESDSDYVLGELFKEKKKRKAKAKGTKSGITRR